MKTEYEFLPELFLRAPYYSYNGYDPERLPVVLADPAFRNAIWLASYAFYQQLRRKDFEYARLTAKEQFSLLKYYNRMCFRPTPFGSFASFSLGKWSSGETARLSGAECATICLLPDLQWLDMAGSLYPSVGTGELLLNPSLYLLGKEYRFVKSVPGNKGKLSFGLEAIPAEPFYTGLIAFCERRLVPAPKLQAWIERHSGCSAAEAAEYMEFLVASQVLFSSDKAPLIGGETVRLNGFPVPVVDSWMAIRRYPLSSPTTLAAIAHDIQQSLPQNILSADLPVCYAALGREWETGGPGAVDRAELTAAINVLHRFASSEPPAALARFISDFRNRFDQRKVPLLEALDPDSGIIYGGPPQAADAAEFLLDIHFPAAEQQLPPGAWTENHRLLFSRWTAAKQHGSGSPVILMADDAVRPGGPLPPTLAVMFRKTEEHLLIEYAGGASATSLVGRFTSFSRETLDLCRKLAALECFANPDVLFADIDHRSYLHGDNINRREQIYDRCININSFTAGANVLPLRDLQLSVRGGELLLESSSLGKRIIPRLSTAYNYQLSGLGIFRLLCDLQFQGGGSLRPFSMENFFPGLRFYPRVLFGQTILCPAKWKFGSDDMAALLNPDGREPRQRIRQFRQDNGLPLKVTLGDYDQQLVFDLSNEQEVRFFLNCISGLETITLHEYLPPAKSVKCGNKPFAGQFIAFLFHKSKIYTAAPPATAHPAASETRDFLLGDEWLYLKLYCTPQVADQILGGILPLFVSQQDHQLFCWFFIRYNEDGDHLRLRFKTRPELVGGLLVSFLAALRLTGADRLIRSYQGDTYQRELERYPPEFISLVENVFREGSDLVCSRLSDAGTAPGGNAEFLFGLAIADLLLHSFLKPVEIPGFCAVMLESFNIEFGGGKALKTDMDAAYRKLRAEIKSALTKANAGGVRLSAMEALAKAASQMPANQRSALLADIIHMQMNRNFQARQRQQEFFVYHCLLKHWSSVAAQSRHSA